MVTISFQSILNAALGEYQAQGFRLAVKGQETTLFHNDEEVKIFEEHDLTIIKVHRACMEYLKGGVKCYTQHSN